MSKKFGNEGWSALGLRIPFSMHSAIREAARDQEMTIQELVTDYIGRGIKEDREKMESGDGYE